MNERTKYRKSKKEKYDDKVVQRETERERERKLFREREREREKERECRDVVELI